MIKMCFDWGFKWWIKSIERKGILIRKSIINQIRKILTAGVEEKLQDSKVFPIRIEIVLIILSWLKFILQLILELSSSLLHSQDKWT